MFRKTKEPASHIETGSFYL